MKPFILPPLSPLVSPLASLGTGILLHYNHCPPGIAFGALALFSLLASVYTRISYAHYLFIIASFSWGYLFSFVLAKNYEQRFSPFMAKQPLATSYSVEHSLKEKMSATHYPLFATLFLGKPLGSTEKHLQDTFSYWGISHYLARSGLHVAITIGLWQILFGFFPRLLHLLALALTLLAYAALSYSGISFSRALIACLIGILYKALRARTSPVQSILLTGFITLAISPFSLLSASFQLSFLLALVIAWLYELTKLTT